MIKSDIIKQLKSLNLKFWLLNFIQMIEKMAYVIVLLQMPIYLAQKNINGGLYLDQTMKGYIFFAWAMVQRLTPFFTGGFTDKIGYKKTLLIASLVIVISYIIMGTQKEFALLLVAIMLLGFGSGLFLPALQASIAGTLNKENESTGWGAYFMLLNLGVFFAPIFSTYFKSLSWEMVFYGSATVFCVNFIILFFTKIDVKPLHTQINILKDIFINFFKKEVFYFILLMSGFIMIYMQFYETFPNYFFDWVDTRSIVQTLDLPDNFKIDVGMGAMLSYEWIRLINSGIIIIAVIPLSWLTSKMFRINALILGIILASLGLILCGISMSGWISIFGIIIYSFGELITNPKFTEQMNFLAKDGKKAMYMGFMNISFALGLGGGALLGGFVFKYFAEKAYLASDYVSWIYNVPPPDLTKSMDVLMQKTGLDYEGATKLLWNTYYPFWIWIFFICFGIIASIGLYNYSKKIK